MANPPESNPPLPEVGPWAKDKIDRLGKYLAAYTTILAAENRKRAAAARSLFHSAELGPDDLFRTVYIDAFAGAGAAQLRQGEVASRESLFETVRDQDEGVREVIAGSPRRALELATPFDQYVFVEQAPDRLALLEGLKREFDPVLGPDRIRVRRGDCNAYLTDLLARGVNWKVWRGVVFLDPFGMHVPWDTVRRLGETGAIEVFINFPLQMCIQRFLRTDALIPPRDVERLDSYFGDHGWYAQCYEAKTDMFGAVRAVKRRDANARLLEWYRARLANHFGYVSKPGLITNRAGGPLYYLLHAGPNATGSSIASYLLEQPAPKRRR